MEIPQIDGPVFAFCGIARPEQFFAGLEAAGVRLANRIAFPDHHRYRVRDIKRLDEAAQSSEIVSMVTTEKDRVRMGNLVTSRPLPIVALRCEIEDETTALNHLVDGLAKHSAKALV